MEMNSYFSAFCTFKKWQYKSRNTSKYGPLTFSDVKSPLYDWVNKGYEQYLSNRGGEYTIPEGMFKGWFINFDTGEINSDCGKHKYYLIDKLVNINRSNTYNDSNKEYFNKVEKGICLSVDNPVQIDLLTFDSQEYKYIFDLFYESSNPLHKKYKIEEIRSLVNPRSARMYNYEKNSMKNQRETILFHHTTRPCNEIISDGIDLRNITNILIPEPGIAFVSDTVDFRPTNSKDCNVYIVRCLLGNIEQSNDYNQKRPSESYDSVHHLVRIYDGDQEPVSMYNVFLSSRLYVTHVVTYNMKMNKR